MSVRIGIDYGPVERLRALLRGAERRTRIKSRAAVEEVAKQVVKDWRQAWSGHRHIPHLPNAIRHEMKTSFLRGPEAEIGIDKSMKQGPLGNIIEFGSVNNAPLPGALPALQAALPRLRRAAEQMSDPFE